MPWDFDEAVQASDGASEAQKAAETDVVDAYKDHARAEKLYHVALARKIWEFKRAGIAITACETLAKGDEDIAALREDRDSKLGLRETAKLAAWRLQADRRDTEGLISWSMRRELAEGYAS